MPSIGPPPPQMKWEVHLGRIPKSVDVLAAATAHDAALLPGKAAQAATLAANFSPIKVQHENNCSATRSRNAGL
jgi:hypothetical protein